MRGFFIKSVLVHGYSYAGDLRRQGRALTQQSRDVSESPWILVLNADAGGNNRSLVSNALGSARRRRRCCRVRGEDVSAINGDRDAARGRAVASGGVLPRQRPTRTHVARGHSAVIHFIGCKIVVYDVVCIHNRCRPLSATESAS